MDSSNKIGIGITTRNRNDLIQECVSNIIKYSTFDKLIIVDDASEIPVVIDGVHIHRFDKQQGIAKGKNKCIEYLEDCDHLFLFDDDCWPIKKGWEDIYIKNAKESGCNHFSYTWYDDLNYHEILDTYVKYKYCLKIDDQITEYSEKLDITHIRIKNVREGRPASYSYEEYEETFYNIKVHKNPHGVMLYISKKCIETIGGFNTEYGLYGGEHSDFSTRVFNCGLNPFGKNLDVDGSDQYFYALDRIKKVQSTISMKWKLENDERITSLLDMNKNSTKFINYKDENNSTSRKH
jgi:GT2 family glycosyltransferase